MLPNSVINLSTHKPQVLREAARVLKPGSTFAVSDVIADPGMDDATRADDQYVGCIAGALTHDECTRYLAEAGLTDVEIIETHRVHEQAGSAIIRARVPARRAARPPASRSRRWALALSIEAGRSKEAGRCVVVPGPVTVAYGWRRSRWLVTCGCTASIDDRRCNQGGTRDH